MIITPPTPTNLLAYLTDEEIHGQKIDWETRQFAIRRAARGVMVDEAGLVGMIKIGNANYYKLPGGGIDAGETVEAALRRELQEETGCNVSSINEIGSTFEVRARPDEPLGLLQISFGYTAKLEGEKGTPHFEADEIAEGIEFSWQTPAEALKLTATQVTTDYEGKFIVVRDLAILTAGLKQLGLIQ